MTTTRSRLPIPARRLSRYPETYEQAEQWITNSSFYNQTGRAPVRCNSQPINVVTASDAQLKAHFEGLMECLVRVWEPPVTNAGFVIVRPTVTIYGEELTTKCGKTGVNAFYCTADQQVYYSNLLPEALPTVRQNKWTADIVMAHEFGHALQGRTGILISAHALGQNSGDEGTELQYTRRLETQADCFSGMFLRAGFAVDGSAAARPRWDLGRSTPPLATTISPATLTSSETTGSRDRANTGEPLAWGPARLGSATPSSSDQARA